eukprot:TRINITY_DN9409_c0_g1_i2.p1 TRINITY_DN9409_c0_g1~~TRINITY_DN9409_c0_g1_i2.p1  ORF type:complete len:109 (-),score=37.93 TRINITY_DN9409_c0_g1_i2:3-329(-)
MQRGLVGSEMCIRDRYNKEVTEMSEKFHSENDILQEKVTELNNELQSMSMKMVENQEINKNLNLKFNESQQAHIEELKKIDEILQSEKSTNCNNQREIEELRLSLIHI